MCHVDGWGVETDMFRYAALGDSITAGYGASSLQLAYPARVVKIIGATARANASNEVLAGPGWTSEDLRGAVIQTQSVPLIGVSAVTIWVGGDDLIDMGIALLNGAPKSVVQAAMKQYALDIAQLVTYTGKVGGAPVILCTQYNPFPNTPIAAEAIGQLNEITASLAARLGTGLAPVASWFDGRQAELIAGYQTGRIQDVLVRHSTAVHPNNLGHQVIAENLAPLVLASARRA